MLRPGPVSYALILGALVSIEGPLFAQPQRLPAILKDGPQCPNFVLIVAHDLAWSDHHLRAGLSSPTPSLDALAQRSMCFARVQVADAPGASLDTEILTGICPVRSWSPEPRATHHETIAERLREAGYLTGHLEHRQLGPGAPGSEHAGSGTSVVGRFSPPTTLMPRPIGDPESVSAEPPSPWSRSSSLSEGSLGPKSARRWRQSCYLSAEFDATPRTDQPGERAARFLKNHRDRPFFLYVSHHASPQVSMLGKGPATVGVARPQGVRSFEDPEGCETAGSIDQDVGRVLDTLDELELSSRTIVIFVCERSNLRDVPPRLVICWPGVAVPGSQSQVPATTIDLYPTILEMAGLKPRAGQELDGLSLASLLRGSWLNGNGPVLDFRRLGASPVFGTLLR